MQIQPCNDFRTVKVGDRVYSYLHGWGTVHTVSQHRTYPVNVRFGDVGTVSFTTSGYYETDNKNPMLFWGLPEVHSRAAPPARYRNLNGIAVFESPIKAVDEIEVNMYIASGTRPEGFVRLEMIPPPEACKHYVRHGLVYPATDQGKQWATMHGKAMLGEGIPYGGTAYAD